ncbi:unnamed protein product, partial [Chrysoparadoxa australica]
MSEGSEPEEEWYGLLKQLQESDGGASTNATAIQLLHWVRGGQVRDLAPFNARFYSELFHMLRSALLWAAPRILKPLGGAAANSQGGD